MAELSGAPYQALVVRVYVSGGDHRGLYLEQVTRRIADNLRTLFGVPGGSIQKQSGLWYAEEEAGYVVEIATPNPVDHEALHQRLQNIRDIHPDYTFYVTITDAVAMEVF